MEENTVYDKLSELTEDLLYISEAEAEFSVYELESGDKAEIKELMEDIASSPFGDFEEGEAIVFFENAISALDTEDEVMQGYKEGFTELLDFLKNTFTDLGLFKVGEVEEHIFIVCKSAEHGSYLLHTFAVES